MPFGSHFLKLLTLPHIDADVQFGTPVVEAQDRKALAQELRSAIAEQFRPSAPHDVAAQTDQHPENASL